MDKFSVIIPTIWKSEYTMELLKRYSDCQYVGEIILIDNASHLNKNIEFQKVIHIKENENTFVNPAWNKGVSLSNFDYITISNDDILFDVNEYYELLTQTINQAPFETLGYIGSHSDNYVIKIDKSPVLELYDNQTNKGGWGCLFSFHKQNWKPIPEQLKIWYGDNWIHMIAHPILHLSGINIETKMSTSSDLEEIRAVRDNDVKEWHRLLGI
ncbi:Glyco_tranf_GTA_type domain containing protein [uncultured Caudovirales phage]|uniref:Glyco_tranf_GTA_type domain containing protein n=1 Tax=uncultured Caudovirales phage TaxID=2100421 RepID=A0A6J5M9I3_9CAUD|nr:Glyco_tranf_GTA_type domain containing protein [uncultured Caudovirales phage]